MNFEQKLREILLADEFRMDLLRTLKSLELKEGCIGAGFVRNMVWDKAHDIQSPLSDVDVLHFDSSDISKETDLLFEEQLKQLRPDVNWSVKNQARMHLWHGHSPYDSINEAISNWAETATAIAVKLTDKNQIEIIAPYGLRDLFDLALRPTPLIPIEVFIKRVKEKKWTTKYPQLSILQSSK